MARRGRRNRRGLGVIRYLTIVCACVVLVVGAVCLYGIQLQNRQADRVSQALRDQFYGESTPEATAEVAQQPATEQPEAAGQPVQQALAATEQPLEQPAATEEPAVETITAEPVPVEIAPTAEPVQVADVPEDGLTALAEGGEDAYAPESGAEMGDEAQPIEPTATPEPVLQEQFAELYEQNNDLVGWLKVCDHIEEPVLYRDNSYYMTRDFYGQDSNAGAIFLDEANSPEMNDDALLIYGHNMKNGTMFGDLDFFRQESYLAQYPIISLQSAWEAEPRQYAIFSLFDASMNSDDPSYIRIRQFNFDTDEEKQAYIDEIQSRSIIDIPIEVDAQDQLVMLVTCSYTHDNGRFLMVGRQLREGETAENIAALYQ